MKKAFFIFFVLMTVCGMLFGGGGGESSAAKYPARPIQIVVPLAPGGDTDMYYRMIAKSLEKEMGVPVVVTNVPGGNATIGMQQVLDSPSDGYTLLGLDYATGYVMVFASKLVPYGQEAFHTVGLVHSTKDWGLVARADAPYNNLKELAEYGKTHEIVYGGLSRGFPSMIGLNIADNLGINMRVVDIGSAAPRIQSLLSKDADLVYLAHTNIADYIESKQFKFITILSDQRFFRMPNVSIPADEGYKSIMAGDKCFPLYFDSRVPPEIIQTFTEVLKKLTNNPEFIAEMKNANAIVNQDWDRGQELLREQWELMHTLASQYNDRM